MRFPFKAVGNILIVTALTSSLYIYWPILRLEWQFRSQIGVAQAIEPKSSEFGIVIPKLGINEKVAANVNPFDKSEYLPILNDSIAHASGSALPDENGNTYLFAHSSDNPFTITRYNTAFYLLEKLETGDEISLYYEGEEVKYVVREMAVVKPWEVEALTKENRNQLTLQTCTPIGTAINRLLVFADPVQEN